MSRARGVAASPSVIIVGAGFGGIGAAIELTKNGFDDITVVEASQHVGGTWHHNTYPGAACDVPSHVYSYSFAPRSDWSALCSPQSEILDYLRATADRFDITRRVLTATKVTACRWEDAACRWAVDVEGPDGSRILYSDAIVLATGQLNQPAYPRLQGLEDFAGHSFHSARWDHDYDLTGKRVAVIGTGASAVQFIPQIQREVDSLTIFQRTGNWLMPRKYRMYPKFMHKIFQRVPGIRRLYRAYLFAYMELVTAMIRHPKTLGRLGAVQSALFMRFQLRDKELRKKVWPDYTFGCKRLLFTSDFLPALQESNVEMVTDRIVAVTPRGPQTADGTIHEVDCIIYATGFRTNDFMFPMDVTGSDGISLRDAWAHGAKAHLGITVAGFPSMFIMYGPNTNTSGGSIIFFLESQARYLRQALQLIRKTRSAAVAVRPEVEAKSTKHTQDRFSGTAWTGCDSWYRDPSGRIVANWPGYMREYAKTTKTLDTREYHFL